MDNLEFEKIWQDNYYKNLYQIHVLAQSKLISSNINSYTTCEAINELYQSVSAFIANKKEFIWENGSFGKVSTPAFSLRFFFKDKLGHICIEVKMEIDDGDSYEQHIACFYINTEMGILIDFMKELSLFNIADIGYKISFLK